MESRCFVSRGGVEGCHVGCFYVEYVCAQCMCGGHRAICRSQFFHHVGAFSLHLTPPHSTPPPLRRSVFLNNWASEWVKMLAPELDKLRLIPTTHMVEEENQILKVVLRLPSSMMCTCMHPCLKTRQTLAAFLHYSSPLFLVAVSLVEPGPLQFGWADCPLNPGYCLPPQ